MDSKIAKQIITENITAYDQIGHHFSATRQYNWPSIKKVLDQYLHPACSVLDLGCGNGRLISILPDHISYLGVDASHTLIDEARIYATQHQKPHQKISWQIENLTNFDKTKQQFDYIIAIASLHHIPSQHLRQVVCQNIFSFLKPQGIFICTNWQLDQPKYQKYCNFQQINHPQLDQNDCLIPWKNQQGDIIANRYYHSFTITEIDQLLSITRFKILENYTDKFNIITISQKNNQSL